MITRHIHGHSHGHLHSRRSFIASENTDQFEGLDLNPPELLEPKHNVMQITTRAEGEKPASGGDSNTTTIALSVVIPLVAAIIGLAFFARKGVLRRRREESTNKFKSMDFGLQDNVQPKGNKRKSAFFGKEKDLAHKPQLSMDMNLSSPYLLPPNLQNSRESFNSIAKTLQSDDPYRPVADYTGSDVGSLQSFKRGPTDRASSIFTSKTRPSGDGPGHGPASPLQSPLPVAQPFPHPRGPVDEIPSIPAKNEFRFVDDGPMVARVPGIQEPPVAATSASNKPVLHGSRTSSLGPKDDHQPMVAEIVSQRDSLPQVESSSHSLPDGPNIKDRHISQASSTSRNSESTATPTAVRPPRKESMPVIRPPSIIEEYHSYADEIQFDDNRFSAQPDDELHMAANQEQTQLRPAGLGVPGQDNRRLSVGLRPLPPDDFLDSEDPEFRANRIRSFYKEYFEDGKPDQNRPPMPQPVNYYEDYDNGALADAPYFDPATKAFVMPYAQPVTRRAMTPPPNNRRPMPGPGQRGPPGPRGPYPGSPLSGGPVGRPRAGSAMSNGGWGARSPRPGSSASNPRWGNQPRRPMPPPAPLNSLPTPSKLKDDSFVLMGAVDFAPPPSFKDQAAGRSQSPLGERLPYKVNVPVHSPLVSAFDDTPALPSPHLLRKSSTFTGLDFAPPRRFKDPEVMSETGSVHSMHSGISGMGLSAIRSGAGRISRLPSDTVFTQSALNDTLKPSWDMRT
ncbi:hypothetical protein F4861DRAFT_30819 [Xylaria intraflava]|nr:hypothetical protein F4861DRAFT_30819 [Xylaria intraflava]